MNNYRFHVVAISNGYRRLYSTHFVNVRKGYHLLASYSTFSDAAKDALTRNRKMGKVVLRDGTNGKRYSIAELRKDNKSPA